MSSSTAYRVETREALPGAQGLSYGDWQPKGAAEGWKEFTTRAAAKRFAGCFRAPTRVVPVEAESAYGGPGQGVLHRPDGAGGWVPAEEGGRT